MKLFYRSVKTLVAAATFMSATAMADAIDTPKRVENQESTSKLLSAKFDPRQVVKIEAGDFHFVPGQIGPVHIHVAPAVGYIAKGEILFQVEGGKPHLLREGDAFYEPAGPRILRFDNTSATEEAIFVDFNLEQEGEPFIVFEQEPTQNIDRRTLPTVDVNGLSVDQVNIFVTELEPSGHKTLDGKGPVLGYVAEGIINLKIKGEAPQRIVAGGSFTLPFEKTKATIVNNSKEVPAKVVSFYLCGKYTEGSCSPQK